MGERDLDVTIDGWRCCTGGSLGPRRVAHAPNGTIFELTHSKQIHMHDQGGLRFARVPVGVVAWLAAGLITDLPPDPEDGAAPLL